MNSSIKIKEILYEYRKWLDEYPMTDESRDSYVSYAKGYLVQLNKCLESIYGYNLLSSIKKKDTRTKLSNIKFIFLLEKAYVLLENGTNSKTLKNYRSGFRLFCEFLFDIEEYYFDETGSEAFQQDFADKYTEEVYTKSVLKKIFIARLITQDRKLSISNLSSGQLMYPARLMNRILNNSSLKNEYKEVLNNLVDDIDCYYGEKEKVTLSSITKMIIKADSTVDLKEKNSKKRKTLLTNHYGKYIPLKAKKGIRDISIDHNIPIDDQLSNQSNEYPKIRRLTEMIINEKKRIPGEKRGSVISSKVYENNKREFTDTFCNALLNEMKLMNSRINGFILMHQSDNSAKGNRY